MLSGRAKNDGRRETADFRTKATFGVTITAIIFLLPMAVMNILTDRIYVATGAIAIVCMLIISALAVSMGRDHQKITLYFLIPAGMTFMIGVFLRDGFIGTVWCYPSVIACYCMLSEKRAWIAVAIILGIGFPMAWLTLPHEYAYRVFATLSAVSVFSGILVRVIDTQHSRLKEQLNRDPLTGLLNRLTLKPRLQAAISDAQQGKPCSTLLAIDVDHFKRINDTFGHEQGDATLCTLAWLILNNLQPEDACFRTGGEEFLVLLQATSENEAFCIAENIRRNLQFSEIVPDQTITASIGIATYVTGDNWTRWVKRADDNLYCAKRSGRNVVVVADVAGIATSKARRKHYMPEVITG